MIYTVTPNPAIDRELTVARIEFDAVLRATRSRVDEGGKGFNVARILSSLGAASTAMGFVGGRAGSQLEEGLNRLGVMTDFVRVGGETRTNISIMTEARGRYIKVNEPGPRIAAAKQKELLAKVEERAGPGDWWVLSGSLPPGVADGYYAEMIALIHRRGGKVVLDSSDGPLHAGLAEKPFLVKPNLQEARELTGAFPRPDQTAEQIRQMAAAIRELGAENVIISMGRHGALLQTVDRCWLAQSPQIKEENPIGAGDALVGGLVYALRQGARLDVAFRWGVACGAATAGLPGTQVCTLSMLNDLLPRVTCTPF